MKCYDKLLKTKFNTDTTDTHIGSQYQPSYDKPIPKQSAAITLNPLTDVQGFDRACARDNGIYIRNTIMFVSGAKDFPRDHGDDLKSKFNLTAESLRYSNVDKALNDNSQSASLVGHSVGGSVVLEMQNNYGAIKV